MGLAVGPALTEGCELGSGLGEALGESEGGSVQMYVGCEVGREVGQLSARRWTSGVRCAEYSSTSEIATIGTTSKDFEEE